MSAIEIHVTTTRLSDGSEAFEAILTDGIQQQITLHLTASDVMGAYEQAGRLVETMEAISVNGVSIFDC